MSDQYGSPYGGQYPPPQQQYPAPGQYPPQYPAPGQYGQQFPYLQQQPPPPPRRRTGLVVGIAIAVVVVVGALVAALVVFTGDDGKDTGFSATTGRRLAVPQQLSGYRAVPGVNVDTLKSVIGQSFVQAGGKNPDALLEHGVAGAFQRTTGPDIAIFFGIALRDLPAARRPHDAAAVNRILDDMMNRASAKLGNTDAPRTFPAGPRGGQLLCTSGRTTQAGSIRLCVWGDGSAIAVDVFVNSQLSLAQAAEQTRTLRAQIEHD